MKSDEFICDPLFDHIQEPLRDLWSGWSKSTMKPENAIVAMPG